MSYRIIFKGQIADEFVDDVRGRTIAERWENGTLTGRISINDNLYEASAIKAIISGFQNPDRTQKNEENAKEISKIRYESEEYFKNKQLQSPEVRAKNTGLAEVLYVATAGHQMSEEIKEQVRARQLAFFKEHPNFAEAKPTCYRDLIPEWKKPTDAAPSIKDLLSLNMIHFAERVVSNGIQESSTTSETSSTK